MLSVYGFIMGLSSFSEEERMHRTSTVGSILNGVIMVGWLGFFNGSVKMERLKNKWNLLWKLIK